MKKLFRIRMQICFIVLYFIFLQQTIPGPLFMYVSVWPNVNGFIWGRQCVGRGHEAYSQLNCEIVVCSGVGVRLNF